MSPRFVALIGERDLTKRAHLAIEASFQLYQKHFDPNLAFRWLPTHTIPNNTNDHVPDVLAAASGIWCTPGSPYENTAGALAAIRFAREQQRPFFGTCGGFQHALMEFSASVLNQPALHQEMDHDAKDPLISKLSCSLVETRARVLSDSNSWYAKTVGATDTLEEFHCNYGLAPAFKPLFAGSDLQFIAHDAAAQPRAFRLSGHPFFVGTLFQPERQALSGSLHPLVREFLHHT